MSHPNYSPTSLPLPADLETVPVLKAMAAASRALAELKGRAAAIPNQEILVDTLILQEARASSRIENIVTTQDELFRVGLSPKSSASPAIKEVALYAHALKLGLRRMRELGGVISNNVLIEMFRLLKGRDDGFRTTPGTLLKNEATGATVHVPPQDGNEIVALMTDVERLVNDDGWSPLDPIIKMAVIHHQFESIHPFPDGNGRIGRILNVLYLVRAGLLETPILYHSRHITHTKDDYYRLLQAVRDTGGAPEAWVEWILYMLEAVTVTANTTLGLVEGVRERMAEVKHRLRDELPRIYSQDLLNNLFRHPYTRIEYVADELGVTRQTATRYLGRLVEHGFVEKVQSGRTNYFINGDLVNLLLDVSGDG